MRFETSVEKQNLVNLSVEDPRIKELFEQVPEQIQTVISQEAWSVLTVKQKIDLLQRMGFWTDFVEKQLIPKLEKYRFATEAKSPVDRILLDKEITDSLNNIVLGKSKEVQVLHNKLQEIEKFEQEHQNKEDAYQQQVEQAQQANAKPLGNVVPQRPSFFGYDNVIEECVTDPQICDQKINQGNPEDASTWLALLIKKWFKFTFKW